MLRAPPLSRPVRNINNTPASELRMLQTRFLYSFSPSPLIHRTSSGQRGTSAPAPTPTPALSRPARPWQLSKTPPPGLRPPRYPWDAACVEPRHRAWNRPCFFLFGSKAPGAPWEQAACCAEVVSGTYEQATIFFCWLLFVDRFINSTYYHVRGSAKDRDEAKKQRR